MTTETDAPEFDFWTDRLGIPTGDYNITVNEEIYAVAKMIVVARETEEHLFYDVIAQRTGLAPNHVELILYILASVTYPKEPEWCGPRDPFTYGGSPRGLFVDDLGCAKRFLAEFEAHIANEWKRFERQTGSKGKG